MPSSGIKGQTHILDLVILLFHHFFCHTMTKQLYVVKKTRLSDKKQCPTPNLWQLFAMPWLGFERSFWVFSFSFIVNDVHVYYIINIITSTFHRMIEPITLQKSQFYKFLLKISCEQRPLETGNKRAYSTLHSQNTNKHCCTNLEFLPRFTL